ncbi:uncharacterized protein LOC126617183 [Malus sylvestris]|uniref:uncharacterized protein LOC126617183 n=1 Tax=Malus sylvestris TaxID=3752 RepID=UPI0021AC381C|nr:uncharacterized protein LOC126617183 [Malus sylvestris]
MYEPDKEKITFVIERGTYCYKVMPFGLKNVKATYQRLVNMMFKKQIGVTMEVYVDDIMVKGKQRLDHIANLAETFNILRKYKMKLSLAKCMFGVSSGRFLSLKLKPYFQAHTVIVMTQYPLRSILHGPDTSQQVMKWALEFGQYGLGFRPHMALKAQALADFITEFTPSLGDVTERPNDALETAEHALTMPTLPDGEFWHLHVDSVSNYKGSGADVALVSLF